MRTPLTTRCFTLRTKFSAPSPTRSWVKREVSTYGRKEEELSKNEALVEYLRNSVKTEKAIELIVKNAKIKK